MHCIVVTELYNNMKLSNINIPEGIFMELIVGIHKEIQYIQPLFYFSFVLAICSSKMRKNGKGALELRHFQLT